MTQEEYCKRLSTIRVMVNELVNDLGGTYSTSPRMLEKVLNDAMNGDLLTITPTDNKTPKLLYLVNNYRTRYYQQNHELI